MIWDGTKYVQPNDRTMSALRKSFPEDFVDRYGPGGKKMEARQAPFCWWIMGFALGGERHWKN